jgi:hypothetical protein
LTKTRFPFYLCCHRNQNEQTNGAENGQGGSNSSSVGPQDDLGSTGKKNQQNHQQSYQVCSQSK